MSETIAGTEKVPEQKRKQRAIDIAKRLIDIVDVREEGRGRVSKNLLRNLLELARSSTLYEEFKLRFLYLVNRNTDRRIHELEKFARMLLKEVEQIKDEKEKLKILLLVIEYTIMARAEKELR